MYTLEQQVYNPFEQLSEEKAAILDHITRRRLGPLVLTALAQHDERIDRDTLIIHLTHGQHFVNEKELSETCKSLKRYELAEVGGGSSPLTSNTIKLNEDTKDTSIPLTYALHAWQLHEAQRWADFFAPPTIGVKSETVASFAVLKTMLDCESFVSGRAIPGSHKYEKAIRSLVSNNVVECVEKAPDYRRLALTTTSYKPALKLINGLEQAAGMSEDDVREDMQRLYRHPTWVGTLAARAVS